MTTARFLHCGLREKSWRLLVSLGWQFSSFGFRSLIPPRKRMKSNLTFCSSRRREMPQALRGSVRVRRGSAKPLGIINMNCTVLFLCCYLALAACQGPAMQRQGYPTGITDITTKLDTKNFPSRDALPSTAIVTYLPSNGRRYTPNSFSFPCLPDISKSEAPLYQHRPRSRRPKFANCWRL